MRKRSYLANCLLPCVLLTISCRRPQMVHTSRHFLEINLFCTFMHGLFQQLFLELIYLANLSQWTLENTRLYTLSKRLTGRTIGYTEANNCRLHLVIFIRGPCGQPFDET